MKNWELDSVKMTTEYKGTYKNIHWTIKKTEFSNYNTDGRHFEWSAGLRGSGETQSFEKCEKFIKKKINQSLKFEKERA